MSKFSNDTVDEYIDFTYESRITKPPSLCPVLKSLGYLTHSFMMRAHFESFYLSCALQLPVHSLGKDNAYNYAYWNLNFFFAFDKQLTYSSWMFCKNS